MALKQLIKLSFIILILNAKAFAVIPLPSGFVYLSDIDPSIQQELRYAKDYNFIGSPIIGYTASQCVLTQQAAEALAQVQTALRPKGLSLKVYDCYRPQRAVNEFYVWGQQPQRQEMKLDFYPRVDKINFVKQGYVAVRSGHTRGSTVDLTIVSLIKSPKQNYVKGQPLVACFAPYGQRFNDGSIDMGTNFDCMDPLSHNDNQAVGKIAYSNRQLLKNIMQQYGFKDYHQEWWHFTLRNEPYPTTYFNFIVSNKT